MKILTFLWIFLSIYVYWITNAEDNTSTYSSESWYELYKQRVKNICDDYKYNPTIVNLDDNYPKIISTEELEELIKPAKEPLDKINEELWSYWSMNSINTAKQLYSEENIKNTKKYLNPDEIKEEVKKGKIIIKNLEKRDKLRKELDKIINGNTDIYSFEKTKEIHRDNMNRIYKCWLISTQKKALLLIKNDLIKINISKKIEWKIDSNIEKLKEMSRSFNCTKTNEKDSIQKLILLKQATYQTCKYISYLEYLKEYNSNIQNTLDPKKWHYTPLEIVQTERDKIWELDAEIKHTYKVFPLAFHAYTEYENNITTHFLLELLKDDYLALREKLHKALNPINQVVYKIVNAMKK